MELVKSRARQLLLVVACAVFALAMGATLAGCGPDDKALATEALDAELSTLSNPSDDAVKEMLGTDLSSDSTFAQLNIDSTQMIQSWLDGYSYEIGEVTVDGDTAQAKTTVTSKQLYAIMSSWEEQFSADVMNQGFTSMDEVYTYAGSTFMDAINSATPATTEVTFTLTKDGDTWTFPTDDASNEQALADALFGGGASSEDVFG